MCACGCAYALRIASVDKILCFTNTLIIIYNYYNLRSTHADFFISYLWEYKRKIKGAICSCHASWLLLRQRLAGCARKERLQTDCSGLTVSRLFLFFNSLNNRQTTVQSKLWLVLLLLAHLLPPPTPQLTPGGGGGGVYVCVCVCKCAYVHMCGNISLYVIYILSLILITAKTRFSCESTTTKQILMLITTFN